MNGQGNQGGGGGTGRPGETVRYGPSDAALPRPPGGPGAGQPRGGGPRGDGHSDRHPPAQPAGGGQAHVAPDQALSTLSAPYRFIPISSFIHEPEWAESVLIDQPLEDGLSGWLDVELEAKSELLVGGERRKVGDQTHIHFFQTPDGDKAIPGASLRGMLRSVLEIAAFGRAAFIDDARYPLRDLRGAREIYGKRMVETLRNGNWRHGNPPLYRPRAEAGWLKWQVDKETGLRKWVLNPCEYARVLVTEMETIKPGVERALRPDVPIPKPKHLGAAARYAAWGPTPLAQSLVIDPLKDHHHIRQLNRNTGIWEGPQAHIQYARARRPGPDETGASGVLVFTGKPAAGSHKPPPESREGDYYGKKKQEFFFHTRRDEWIDVTALKADFLEVHEPDFNRGIPAPDNDSWLMHWKAKFEAGEEIPAFYIRDPTGAHIEAMGLAMMFRLAHRLRKRDLLWHANPRHSDPNVRDIPTLMFGPLLDDSEVASSRRAQEAKAKATGKTIDEIKTADKAGAFKGRVSCEMLTAVEIREGKERCVLLASPKGQFFPAYVEQPRGADGRRQGPDYASYTAIDVGGPEVQRPELAGRKRYPSRPSIQAPAPTQQQAAMASTLHPVGVGSSFRGRVRFHNLMPEELGALVFALELWAPEWGERPDLRHRLGMGKPFGYGDASIRITRARVEPNVLEDKTPRPDGAIQLGALRDYADRFVNHMTKAFDRAMVSGSTAIWRTSEQVELLLAMSDPTKAKDQSLWSMKLDPDAQHPHPPTRRMLRNEFGERKGLGHVLPPYPRRSATTTGADPSDLRDRAVFPRDDAVLPARTDLPLALEKSGSGQAAPRHPASIAPFSGARVELSSGAWGVIDGGSKLAPNKKPVWPVRLNGQTKVTFYPEHILRVVAAGPKNGD